VSWGHVFHGLLLGNECCNDNGRLLGRRRIELLADDDRACSPWACLVDVGAFESSQVLTGLGVLLRILRLVQQRQRVPQ
jgi:hypothetical protein